MPQEEARCGAGRLANWAARGLPRTVSGTAVAVGVGLGDGVTVGGGDGVMPGVSVGGGVSEGTGVKMAGGNSVGRLAAAGAGCRQAVAVAAARRTSRKRKTAVCLIVRGCKHYSFKGRCLLFYGWRCPPAISVYGFLKKKSAPLSRCALFLPLRFVYFADSFTHWKKKLSAQDLSYPGLSCCPGLWRGRNRRAQIRRDRRAHHARRAARRNRPGQNQGC